jgi:hypothetical protein
MADCAGRTDVTAVFRDCRLDVGRGAVAVVRQGFDDEADAAGAETFITDFLIIRAVALRRVVDRAFDIVLGMPPARAVITALRRRAFIAGSGNPDLAATVISRLSFENAAARFLSCAPLRCMMFLNLECPAIG